MITSMDKDGDGVDRGEFVCGMLVAMGVVDEADVLPILQRFDELDVDRSGRLDPDDLAILAAQQEQHREQCHPPTRKRS